MNTTHSDILRTQIDQALDHHPMLPSNSGQGQIEVVDLIEIPAKLDPLTRLRTVEEALEELAANPASSDTRTYLIQARPKHNQDERGREFTLESPNSRGAPSIEESPYLPNGKLNAPFLSKNGEILFRAGDYSLARNVYRTIFDSGEKPAHALYWLARCYEQEGQTTQAEKHYEESITYQPSIEAFQRWAALLIRNRKDEEAAEVMERSLTLKDISGAIRSDIHKATANCWLRIKSTDRAEQHYLKAIDLNPNSDASLSSLAQIYFDKKKIQESAIYFQKAYQLNPRNFKAITGIGLCKLALAEKREAHDLFARSLEIQIHQPQAIYYLVKCAYELKSYAVAAKILEGYIQVAPINVNLLYSLAGLQFHLGRIHDAGQTIGRIYRIEPNHSGAKELQKLIEQYAIQSKKIGE